MALRLGDHLREGGPDRQRKALLQIARRVALRHDGIRITLCAGALRTMIGAARPQGDQNSSRDATLTLDFPARFRRRGVEMKLVISDGRAPPPRPDPNLTAMVARARDWFDKLATGEVSSARDLARRHSVDPGDVSRILPLAFLAPDIVECILDGRQPVGLTASRLLRTRDLPTSWTAQRRELGFR